MASSLSSSRPLPLPIRATQGQGDGISSQCKNFPLHDYPHKSSKSRHYFARTKAASTSGNPNPKPKSVICTNCDGNGAVLCSQCKGSGVNSADVFGGQFKAGDSCWLCGGKKDMLCGDCNGAGFIGGFMSTLDE